MLESSEHFPKNEIEKPVEYEDNFSGGKLGEFWEQNRVAQNGLEFVPAPDRPGETALKITVHPGDFLRGQNDPGPARERCEVAEKPDYPVNPELGASYSASFYLPEDLKAEDTKMVIMQWRTNQTPKDPNTQKRPSPPMALRYNKGALVFTIQERQNQIELFKIPDCATNTWHDITIQYQINQNHQGQCQVVLDGQEASNYSGTIGYENIPTDLHFRMGIYRRQLEKQQSVLFGRFKREAVKQKT